MREKTKHTPGPWRADDNGDGTHCITAGHGDDIADTRSSVNEKANARLIKAAPDLLAACKIMLPLLEHAEKCEASASDGRGDRLRSLRLQLMEVRSAIAKAE